MNQLVDAPPQALAGEPAATPAERAPWAVVGRGLAHESAHLHVAGAAAYTDDLPELAGTLHCALGLSPVAHGTLRGIDLDALRALPGVVDVLTAQDIPGTNDCGPIAHDDRVAPARKRSVGLSPQDVQSRRAKRRQIEGAVVVVEIVLEREGG